MAPEEDEFDLFSWKTVAAILVAVVLISSIFFGYNVISGTHEPYQPVGDIAEDGDTVYLNYTGRFVDGTVFDTTHRDIAENNYLYPKVRNFEVKTLYQPYNYVLGNGAKILGQKMSALDDEIRGMKVGQTKTVTLAPEDGFGPVDASLFETMDLVEPVPLYDTDMNKTDFVTKYKMEPKIGLTFEHEMGWNASVYYIDYDTDTVTIKHQPFIGEVIDFNGVWSSEVISVDSTANGGQGEITIKHLLSPSDVNSLYGSDDTGDFIVSGYDETAGTVTLDYNNVGAGKELIFEITLVSLTKN